MQISQLVAHRGHPARFPENSRPGVADALAAGASWLEVDLQLSKEGTPWLYHDETLFRLSGQPGRVVDLTDAEFAALPVSEPGRLGESFEDETAFSLEGFVELLGGFPDARAFVEVKPHAVAAHGPERVFDEVFGRLAPVLDRVVLISFSFELLAVARERCALPIAPILRSWRQRGSEEVARLAPEFTFCNVKRLPRRGRIDDAPGELVLYEVVDPALAERLVTRGAALVETFAIRDMMAALTSGDDER